MSNNIAAPAAPVHYQIGVIGQSIRANKEIYLEEGKTYVVDPHFYQWLRTNYPDNVCNLNYKPSYLLVRAVLEGEFNNHVH